MRIIPMIRLYRIRKIRKLRDEMVHCENLGRAEHLILKFPNVTGWRTGWESEYQIFKVFTLKMSGGYRYNFSGSGDMILGFKAAGEFAYKKWRERYFKKHSNA